VSEGGSRPGAHFGRRMNASSAAASDPVKMASVRHRAARARRARMFGDIAGGADGVGCGVGSGRRTVSLGADSPSFSLMASQTAGGGSMSAVST
jgi:hypothetical protein